MGLRMKDFNVLGVHWKIWFLGGEFTKNQYIGGGENCLKRGWFGQYADLRARKMGWCFWRGVDTPNAYYKFVFCYVFLIFQ